jgi:hypothetical protein
MNEGQLPDLSGGNRNATVFILCESIAVLILWITVFITSGTPFPYDYDSVNYALAITEKFDLRIDQPHLPYVFHIFFCRAFTGFIRNPFILQQIVNLIYCSIMLICFCAIRPSHGTILLGSSMPLILFFTCVPLLHSSALAAGAATALLLILLHDGKISPVVPGIVFFICYGFRPDLAVFLGPVVALGIWKRCSLRQWLCIGSAGILILLLWYLPASLLSGGISPFKVTAQVSKTWLSVSSVLYGATPAQHARSALRFLIYPIGILGPGGIFLIVWNIKYLQKGKSFLLLTACIPLFLFGLFLFIPYPHYYAPVLGFLIIWTCYHCKKPLPVFAAMCGIIANVFFFWFMPAPQWYGNVSTFGQRALISNVKKQVLYIGANCRSTVLMPRKALAQADTILSKCSCFSAVDDYLIGSRIWSYMSSHRWHNRYVETDDSGCCRFIYDPHTEQYHFDVKTAP